MFCTNCGAQISADANFCAKCGNKIYKDTINLEVINQTKQQETGEKEYLEALDFYYGNNGKSTDEKKALSLFLEAAKKGFIDSYCYIGNLFSMVDTLPKDLHEAAKWYKKGAEAGSAKAHANLGLAYLEGEGVNCN